MNRRAFIKKGVLFVPAFGIFVPKLKARTSPIRQRAEIIAAQAAQVSSGGGAFSPNATHFTTSTDYLSRSNFVGEADGKTGIFSLWLKKNDEGQVRLFWSPATDFMISILSTKAIRVAIYNDAGSVLSLQLTSTSTGLCDGAFHHIIMAWDSSDSTKCKIVVDGVEGTTVDTCLNNLLNYTLSSWQVSDPSANGFNGDISELHWYQNQWIDLTVASNVQKWRKVTGHPEDTGSTGNTPTGTSSTVLLRNAAASIGTNSGTGGNFTINGAPSSATPP